MSNLTNKGKLISRFEIGFDNETKVEINSLKGKLDEVTRALSVKNDSHGDRLLAAMQAQAANDAPQSELKQLGQWVFEGQDAKWVSAAVNTDGRAYLHNMPKNSMYFNHSSYGWCSRRFDLHEMQLIKGSFNPSGFAVGFIERETVNDVDYLSETVPEIQGMDAREIIIDECDWLSESAPQITQADMQLIFIKNLSETLIQRMHSMNRFSEDDYAIGGNDLKAWDIVVDCDGLFGFTVCDLIHHESNLLNRFRILRLKKFQDTTFTHGAIINGWRMDDINWHTITEDQLPAFRVALEACYA